MNESNAVVIIEPQNIQTISQTATKSLDDNARSHAACLAAGNALLGRIASEGMSESLDAEIATYIDKAKKTLKVMNERRQPVTQMFDRLRKVYTTLENDIDPTKADTVVGQLQRRRNDYAAELRRKALAAQQAEAARIALAQARERYRQDIEEDYKRQLGNYISRVIARLGELLSSLTLDNYDTTLASVKDCPTELPAQWINSLRSEVITPVGMDSEEAARIRASTLAATLPKMHEQYMFEITTNKDDVLDVLPSKRAELQRAACASAEQAAQIKADIQAKEAAAAAAKEAERLQRQQQQKAEAELAARNAAAANLFDAAAPAPAVKATVKQKPVVETADDIMAIVSFWWGQEGRNLPIEDLVKIFRRQITYAEKAANAKPSVLIPNVRYQDEVKAK